MTSVMNPDQTKNRHVEPAMNQFNKFNMLPYTVLLTVIVLGISILLYCDNTNSTNYIDDIEIDHSIERLA